MKRMIPEKPANTKVSLCSIVRTTDACSAHTTKNSSTQRLILSHPLFLLIQVLIKLTIHLEDMPN